MWKYNKIGAHAHGVRVEKDGGEAEVIK